MNCNATRTTRAPRSPLATIAHLRVVAAPTIEEIIAERRATARAEEKAALAQWRREADPRTRTGDFILNPARRAV